MFFHVRELALKPGHFNVELEPGRIDFLDPKVWQKGPLKASGKAELVSDSLGEIRVKGHVHVDMEAECDRCLDPAAFTMDGDFELYYRPVEEGYGEEAALDESESEMGFYEGDGIKLNDALREYALLALPMQRLCGEGCKGLCPVCGQNRNQQECQCQTKAVDERWAALKTLK